VTPVFWAVAVFLALFAVVLIRLAVRQWHGAGRPLSYWLRNAYMDAETRAGYDRGSLVLGVAMACLAVVIAITAVAGPGLGNGSAWGTGWLWVGAVLAGGMLACTALFLTIMYFNRPRFLVPPQLRHEMGAIAGRRRRRREHRPLM
jgi:hypothetical protein